MTLEEIDQLVKNNRVVLFMKGMPTFPQCGFSGRAIQILKVLNVADLVTYDVLSDEELRSNIKEYSSWPTVPQLYINGELIGGSDIMMEMYENGELADLLK